MEIASRYNPADVEDKWYQHWLEKKYFASKPDEREPYTVVIPPPNVTGVLHMGHMLNNTVQDMLVRHARQSGKNACWVPGTDHASIATEAKVVKMLREKGIKKSDLTRDEFLQHAFKWKEEYGGIILKQLEKLGASCDWDRTAFTMDEVRSKAVIKAFVDLQRKGKLYRKKRMVNWDPEAKTVLSNEEVLHKEEQSRLYFLKYKIEDSEGFITVATTRPETVPGDSAVAVHPDDPRYQHLKGLKAIVPGIGRAVPIIFDDYVEMEFGTGALKVTPAHDVHDHEIGERHNLEVIDIFNEDGTMSSASSVYVGEDRFVVRKKFVKDLKTADLVVKIEDYTNSVGRSERTNSVVEPRLSLQWYVDMESIAKPALEAVMGDEVEFFPKTQKNVYRHWMENIRDWCISRQLWWGHRIPAWYYQGETFVAETVEEALEGAQHQFSDYSISVGDLKQDEDVLDTWFSSWLWPISLFDGFETKEEIDYYYPTNVLVTGWDIIFLWVARMVMAGYEWKGEKPFKHVYFTGMVRDQQRRKMSKSLGNSPDALKLIEEFGADGVRFGMLSCSPVGGDLLFDDKLCLQGRNFSNKIWNALRLIDGWETIDAEQSVGDKYAVDWMINNMNKVLEEIDKDYKAYRLSDALMKLYNFVWTDFCSWFLEMIKPGFGDPISATTKSEAIEIYSKICSILHPFMPFITEEIWHNLKERKEGEDCVVSLYPLSEGYDSSVLAKIDKLKDIVTNTRDIRNKNAIKMKEELALYAIDSKLVEEMFSSKGLIALCVKMANLSSFEKTNQEDPSSIGFISGTEKFFLKIDKEIDVEAELEEKNKELVYQQGFVASVNKKLSNERFVNGAPDVVVNKEKQKLADGEERIRILGEEIARLKKLQE